VLMLFIDDASSSVFARFYFYEGTIPALDSLRRYIHRPALPISMLNNILAIYYKRCVAKDFTICFNNSIFQLAQPTTAKQVMLRLYCIWIPDQSPG